MPQPQRPEASVRPPGLLKLLLEARAPLEYAASLVAAPWLLSAPRGDGHAVLVYPGLLASDFSTRPLRRLLRTLGHDARGWDQGRNLGARSGVFDHALQRLRTVHTETRRKVSLVGWSLGGLYAREIAKMAPEIVRAVVTLGSPFTGPRDASNARRTYEWLQRGRAHHRTGTKTCAHRRPCRRHRSTRVPTASWPGNAAWKRRVRWPRTSRCKPATPGSA